MAPNMHSSLFLIHHFVCTYMHNSKTTGCIRTFHILNDCFTIEDVYFVSWSCMQYTISKLWLQTHIATAFWCDVLCVLTLVTQKLPVVYGPSTYQMTALLLEMSIFWVRTTCKILLVSYGSKHASQSLFNKPFCILQVIYRFSVYQTIALLSKTFLVCLRVAWEILLESYAPDTHQSFSDTALCVYTASPYIHPYFVSNYAWQQNSCTLWLHTTHQTMALLPMMQWRIQN